MKKFCCLLLALALLCMGACGKKNAEAAEQVYVDEGTAETATEPLRDVAILFTAGCAGREAVFYSRLSALRQQYIYDYLRGYVGLVDLGGNTGENSYLPADVMNSLGYEAAIPAAGDFSSGMDTILTASNGMQFPYLCCNLVCADTGSAPLSGWTMASYGAVTVAYVGVALPGNMDSAALCDGEGNSYSLTDCAAALNTAAADAGAAGAEYVIALCACGGEAAEELLAAVSGVDVFLDGDGSGESREMTDKEGKAVLYGSLNPEEDSAGTLVIRADGGLEVSVSPVPEERDENVDVLLRELGFAIEEETETESVSESVATEENS